MAAEAAASNDDDDDGNNEEKETLTPKVDVYTLGNIFYTILTKERVFHNISKRDQYQVSNMVTNGQFPIHFLSQGKPNYVGSLSECEKAIYDAMGMCHVWDVEERSSAEEVEVFLRGEMERLNVSFF